MKVFTRVNNILVFTAFIGSTIWLGYRQAAPPSNDAHDTAPPVKTFRVAPLQPELLSSQQSARTVEAEPVDLLTPSSHTLMADDARPPTPQSLDDFLEQETRCGRLPVEIVAVFRQAAGNSLRAGRTLAKTTRKVLWVEDSEAMVYDFLPNHDLAQRLRVDLATALSPHVAGHQAEALLAALTEAAEGDPSLDMLNHHRQIIIQHGEGEDRWEVTDRTYTSEGSLVAANTVFLGRDDEGELVWPDEYVLLLGE
ncbi:MAG: hypothetical protein HC841_01305 [Verrucomicrobiae bacterium]|nr:hypothetical protein [Verrucomicrobiae bacterium]